MADVLTPEQRHKNMSRIRNKDTKIEIRLRHALWNEGIRYRKNYKKLPGKPDITITKHKIAVFCDSSFFHGKDYEYKKKPGTNTKFWMQKIESNMRHDNEINKQLESMDWIVLRFWDTDINNKLDECVQTIKDTILMRMTEG